MSVGVDLEIKEERKLHFKKESGRNMFLKNRPFENYMEDMERIEEHSKIF